MNNYVNDLLAEAKIQLDKFPKGTEGFVPNNIDGERELLIPNKEDISKERELIKFKNDEIEIWKPIPDFEGYQASNLGRVKSFKKHKNKIKERILKPRLRKNDKNRGEFTFSINNKQFKVLKSHCVLNAFEGKKENKNYQCLHWNGQSSDDKICNLRWGTDADNKNDAKRLGEIRVGSDHSKAILNEDLVKKIRERYKNFSRTDGMDAISRELGLHKVTIRNAIIGKTWKHVK